MNPFPKAIPPQGTKDDQHKVRFDLIAPEFLFGIADILTLGAAKYAARNWEKGIMYGRVFGALQRHLWAWWQGEESDPESHKSHLWHAGCCLMFLTAYEARKQTDLDDRSVHWNGSKPD